MESSNLPGNERGMGFLHTPPSAPHIIFFSRDPRVRFHVKLVGGRVRKWTFWAATTALVPAGCVVLP